MAVRIIAESAGALMEAVRRVGLVGATGMLGGAFRSAFGDKELVCLALKRSETLNAKDIFFQVANAGVDVLINCAADTDVEGAEDAPLKALLANAVLPDLLAIACKRAGIKLVHFSSTGCYGNYKAAPYDDYDVLQPTTVHHKTKAAGEAAVQQSGCDHLILRLGWLFGGALGHRKNFVWSRIIEAQSKNDMASDPYQLGNPTNVDDVVKQTIVAIRADLAGTFNCVATGVASRLDYVTKIIDLAGLRTNIRAERYKRRAPVSPNEAAYNAKLDLMKQNIMPLWSDALARYVQTLPLTSYVSTKADLTPG